MAESSETGRTWATAVAVVAIVALLTGVYAIHQFFSLPGRAIAIGREVVGELRDLAATFHQGKVETAFYDYATHLSGTNKLQVAELRRFEIYTRTESSTLLWGTLRLPDVVVEARVPVEYVYYLDLEKSWRFDLEEHRLRVRAPALSFNLPSLDVSRLEYDIRSSSILRDENAAIGALQSGLTELSRQRAQDQIPLVRETARRQAAKFVAQWLSASFERGDGYTIEVVFEGEPLRGQGITFGNAEDAN